MIEVAPLSLGSVVLATSIRNRKSLDKRLLTRASRFACNAAMRERTAQRFGLAPTTMTRLLLIVLILAASTWADSGTMQFRQVSGAFVVTVFTSPSDISVFVQRVTDQEPVLDAAVSLQVTSASGKTFSLPATREQAHNKLTYSAPMAVAGRWNLSIEIRRGDSFVNFAGAVVIPEPLPIASSPAHITIPVCFLLFYIGHQLLIRNREGVLE